MPTFHDHNADAVEAAEAVRALAHATMRFDRADDPARGDGPATEHPEDTYWVLGDVLAIVRSLTQVVHQLGAACDRHAQHASTDDGDPAAGRSHVRTIHHHVHDAMNYLEHTHATLNTAMSTAGQIAWTPPAEAELPIVAGRILPDPPARPAGLTGNGPARAEGPSL